MRSSITGVGVGVGEAGLSRSQPRKTYLKTRENTQREAKEEKDKN